jgi:toxin-antitoxin system PIN domain toxin
MTPDANVLVAASRSDHPHHVPALAWLNSALDAAAAGPPVLILPVVTSGFFRIVTHSNVFSDPMPYPAARAFLRAVLDSPCVEMPTLGREWPLFEALCGQQGLTGNDIPDAWIAAAVLTNHDRLVSFDRGFLRFLTPEQLTLLRP